MNTWEEATRKVADEIRDTQIGGYPDPLSAVETFIDLTHRGQIEPRAGLMLVADEATTVFALATNQSRATALSSVCVTLAEKQADYGPQNILWAGMPGILLRMHDKVARIRNLETRGLRGSNEPLTDSWLDLVGYAIVGVMLLDGTFELPLLRDVPVTAVPVAAEPVASATYDVAVDAAGNYLQHRPIADATANPFTQAEEDPAIKEAFRQFVAAATAPAEVTPDGDDAFQIEGGGTINVYPAPDGSHTHVTLTDSVGGVLTITASHGLISVDSDGTVFDLNHNRATVLICMLLGAAESALGWRNTNITAEVPRDRD